jgi:hypothetical protein
MTMAVSPDRHTAMTDALAEVRPTATVRMETVLLAIGAVCIPTGLVAIIVGWYGVAHTGHLYEQNSYLISGGILGLALVFIGGFLYFGYWMTRQIHATNAASQQALRAIARLEVQLAPAPSATPSLLATERGTLLHRPECRVVAGKVTRAVPAGTAGFEPCRICRPFGE